MKKLASTLTVGFLLAACAQTPPPQAPQTPPPAMGWGPPPGPGRGFGPPGDAMDHDRPGGDPMMARGMGEMAHHGGMHGDHERGMPRGDDRMRRGPEGDREVMSELKMLGVHFYPPPMLIKRAAKIGLTPDQISKIRQEVLSAQARSVDLKAKVEKAKIESIRLLAADKVDERAVGVQIDEATKAGAELRKLQLSVMLHVRDLLTPDQLKKLEERKQRHHEGAKPGDGKQAMDDDDDDDDDDEEEEG